MRLRTWNEIYNKGRVYEDIDLQDYQFNENKNMNNGILKLDWINVKSAIIYGLVIGVGAVIFYMIKVGTVFALDWKLVVDAFVFGFLGSLVKNLFTTNNGDFLGIIKVIPPTQ
jgi:hypothetical protein